MYYYFYGWTAMRLDKKESWILDLGCRLPKHTGRNKVSLKSNQEIGTLVLIAFVRLSVWKQQDTSRYTRPRFRHTKYVIALGTVHKMHFFSNFDTPLSHVCPFSLLSAGIFWPIFYPFLLTQHCRRLTWTALYYVCILYLSFRRYNFWSLLRSCSCC